jgi:hypothetical protein
VESCDIRDKTLANKRIEVETRAELNTDRVPAALRFISCPKQMRMMVFPAKGR